MEIYPFVEIRVKKKQEDGGDMLLEKCSMRLNQEKADFLKNTIRGIAPDAQVMLFGSRTDDRKKGGDIDILVLCQRRLSFSETIKIKIGFWKVFGEQKLDIVSYTFQEEAAFKDIALESAIEL